MTHLCDGSWYDALGLRGAASLHGVSLASSSLPIAEQTDLSKNNCINIPVAVPRGNVVYHKPKLCATSKTMQSLCLEADRVSTAEICSLQKAADTLCGRSMLLVASLSSEHIRGQMGACANVFDETNRAVSCLSSANLQPSGS